MKKIICVLFMLTIIMLGKNNNKETVLIPEESIRFRIIANSNSNEDQDLKRKIKNEIQTEIISKLNANSYESTEKTINESTEKINQILENYNTNYSISYGKNYFPEKSYKGVIYPEGEYKSLVITLGEGIGDNWWCVLFPPLCLLEAEENDYEEIEYKLYINKILNNFKH